MVDPSAPAQSRLECGDVSVDLITALARTAQVFNDMMDRLETSFHQATRFSADASHELKTPLARLQAEIEHAAAAEGGGSPPRAVLTNLIEEIHQIKAIVDKLLLLSLADAGQMKLSREPVNLTLLLEDLAEDCRALAPGLTIECALAPDVTLKADPQLIERALQNLTLNAVKFNHPDGRIHIELEPDNDQARIRIANTGPCVCR